LSLLDARKLGAREFKMAEKQGYNRRDFLKIIGASTGVAAAGCGKELPEKIIPYVIPPDDVVPGVATWYAATCKECSAGCGTLVRTREGRVVKVEGNPAHPVNKGGLCAIGQSSVQGLYDPDRVREPLKRDVNGVFRPISWKEAVETISKTFSAASKDGKEIALIAKPTSASENAIIKQFEQALPGVKYYQHQLYNRDLLDQTAEESFGRNSRLHFDFSKADVVVSFGADYLETWLSPVEFTKGFSSKRVPQNGKISNVFHFEPRLSLTAANADVWYKTKPGTEHLILQALIVELGGVVDGNKKSANELLKETEITVSQLRKVAEALKKSKGASLVIAGGCSSSGAQAKRLALLATQLNSDLGNLGNTVFVYKDETANSNSYGKLLELVGKCKEENSKVAVAFLSDVNPVYSLPEKAEFASALAKVSLVVAHATHLDETAKLAHIVLPKSTSFEAWSDSEPLPGVFNINQPSMQPLYQTQSLGDTILAILANKNIAKAPEGIGSFYDYMRVQWKKRLGDFNFESKWVELVEKGGDWSGFKLKTATQKANAVKFPEVPVFEPRGLTLVAFPTVQYADGATANRPWMQEIPDPLTSSVWSSWIEVHPETALEHGLEQGKVGTVTTDQGVVEAPVYITKNINREVIAMPIGLGRTGLGRFSSGVGANVLAVLPKDATDGNLQFVSPRARLSKSIATEKFVLTHGSDSQHARGLIRSVALAKLGEDSIHDSHVGGHGDKHADPHGADPKHSDPHQTPHGAIPKKAHHDPKALGPQKLPDEMYSQMNHPVYRWGMSVDLAKCTGCSACVTACYAENNIPVVGKELVERGREMSWLRIERYFDGPDHAPVSGFLPMMCQHCGNAPCEPVCPVYATYHSDEGLNTMVYNRCVGTRYCSNNCSYKVRRFNWFKYEWPKPMNWQLNPDVTVRAVGVMEKCTFCIQRIREGENTAKNEGRLVKDGEIQPACASSCPADAIVFGNLKDKESQVAKKAEDPRVYKILQVELNTQPAVHYLAKVTHEEESKCH
jgi:anaerobic selenocysteine-containing dehydrogenase/Fe-S-cluster-containing dehydrogenase component